MATVASVVADHNSLNDADEVEAAYQIVGTNLDAGQQAELLDRLLDAMDNTQITALTQSIKNRTPETLVMIQKKGGSLLHPNPIRP